MEGKDGFSYNGAPEPNDYGFDKGVIEEQQSVLGNLKRSNSERASAFGSYVESQKAKEQHVIYFTFLLTQIMKILFNFACILKLGKRLHCS